MKVIRLTVGSYDSDEKVWTFTSSSANRPVEIIDVHRWCGEDFLYVTRNFHVLTKAPGEARGQLLPLSHGSKMKAASPTDDRYHLFRLMAAER